MQIRNALKIPAALLALAGLTNTAAAFTDCPTFPKFGAVGSSIPQSGCGVGSHHRGNNSLVDPNARNVVVSMDSNSSGASRRVITIGLNGTHPLGPNCLISRTSLGASNTPPGQCTSNVMNQIEMHIQTN